MCRQRVIEKGLWCSRYSHGRCTAWKAGFRWLSDLIPPLTGPVSSAEMFLRRSLFISPPWRNIFAANTASFPPCTAAGLEVKSKKYRRSSMCWHVQIWPVQFMSCSTSWTCNFDQDRSGRVHRWNTAALLKSLTPQTETSFRLPCTTAFYGVIATILTWLSKCSVIVTWLVDNLGMCLKKPFHFNNS